MEVPLATLSVAVSFPSLIYFCWKGRAGKSRGAPLRRLDGRGEGKRVAGKKIQEKLKASCQVEFGSEKAKDSCQPSLTADTRVIALLNQGIQIE